MSASTHGEEWYAVKLMFNEGCSVKEPSYIGSMTFTPRMSRMEANEFYRNKSREVFASLGYSLNTHFVLDIDELVIEVRKKTEKMLKREARKILMSGYLNCNHLI